MNDDDDDVNERGLVVGIRKKIWCRGDSGGLGTKRG